MNTTITRQLIPEASRIDHTAALFGIHFPMQLEPFIYSMTGNLTNEYNGGYWKFYALSNGGFYMAPNSDKQYQVSCDNGFKGQLSANALGITASLYTYSHLSFSSNEGLANICAQHYHLLRDYMLEQKEVSLILRAESPPIL